MTRCKQSFLHQLLRYCIVLIAIHIPCTLFAQKEFYTPKSLIIPLHDQKNQLHISVGRGGGYDLNLSYAFTNKLAIFTTGTFDNGTKKRVSVMGDRYNVKRNDYVLKGGFGYFTSLENKFFSILEYYAGAGISKIDNGWYFTSFPFDEVTHARYWTAFGQFNAGNKVNRSEYALGVRLAYSQYTDFNFFDTHPNVSYIKKRYENLRGLNAEPVISYSYNLKGFKLNAQIGISAPLITHSIYLNATHTTYQNSEEIKTVVRSKEGVELVAALGRISLQYNLNFKGPK